MRKVNTILNQITDLLCKPDSVPNFPGLFRGKIGIAVFLGHRNYYQKKNTN